ncbi:unnamed protein product [Prunus armeniaca]
MGENEKSTKAAVMNPSDPYSLHSLDHPGIVLASQILVGDNYGPWSRSAAISLSAKNKIDFINAYSAIRGQILLMDPLPDTRKTYSLVLQQEKQVEVSLNREHLNHHAMSVTSNKEAAAPSHQSYKGKPPLHCSYCDQDRHSVETCYYLHGFPPGHKLHGKSVKPPNRRKSTANHVKAETESVKNSDTSHTTPTSDGPKFTTEEYNQLMAMLRKNNDGNPQHYANTTGITTSSSPVTHVDPHSKLCWIIDSGATDHVTSSIELTNPQLLPKSATIQLPDGGQTHIESIGSLQVTRHIKLDEVLKVPQFQDAATGKMIGLGKQHNGLYYLAQDQNPILAQHIRNLWHQRLGHPSIGPLQVLTKTNSKISFNSSHVCDICL